MHRMYSILKDSQEKIEPRTNIKQRGAVAAFMQTFSLAKFRKALSY